MSSFFRVVFTLLLSAGCWLSSVAWSEDFSSQLAVVDERVVVAGLVDLDALRAEHPGDVLVVDLRTEAEGTPEEAARAASLGLGYRNIPVSSATVDPNQVATLNSVLAEAAPDTLVVVHCVSGNRAGMLWGAAALEQGIALEEIRLRLDGVLTKQPTIDGLEAYAAAKNAR
jgi:uncharacterized protein (TIGR01244 family)